MYITLPPTGASSLKSHRTAALAKKGNRKINL